MKQNIIFFVKYPKENKVKTRLGKSVDKALVVELYKCFVADMLETMETLNTDIAIFFQPDVSKENMRSWIGSNHPLFEQEGDDLGERMYHAFRQMFQNGNKECIIIGSDTPDLPATIYQEAFARLKASDGVIGPATDGGYYLLGLHKQSLAPSLFQDILWSSEYVFSQTLEKIRQLHYKVNQLPEWEDIDTIENLLNLYHRNLTTQFYHSKTMQLILSSKFKGALSWKKK